MNFILAAIAFSALILIWLTTQSGISGHDTVSDTSQNPNFPPPPSLGQFGDQAIDLLFEGIRNAEGYGPPQNIPTRANNPLDLVIPNWKGPKLGEGISVFSTIQEGTNRGKYQLYLIGAGLSKNFSLDMTISDLARKWTTTNPDQWALTVSRTIGTTPDIVLRDLYEGTAS